MNNYSTVNWSSKALVVAAIAMMVLVVGACGGGGDAGEAGTPAAANAGAEAMKQLDGRGVSATDEELILSTPGGEWTFKIRPEDVAAIDPAHVNSHAAVPEIGFRVFYVTQDGVDYAVSVEEIDATSLGF